MVRNSRDIYPGDDELDAALYDVGYYDEWDDDDTLSEAEWEIGVDEHLGAYDSGKYSDWDTNGDGKVSESEFHDGLFTLIDDDKDGRIGEDDWDLFNDDNGLFC